MKINGEFILREVAGDTILVPVGKTALRFNGIITLEPVGTMIWKGIEAGKTREEILAQILENFDVEPQVASADLDEFLQQLKGQDFLTCAE